jgi:hypothetical protein
MTIAKIRIFVTEQRTKLVFGMCLVRISVETQAILTGYRDCSQSPPQANSVVLPGLNNYCQLPNPLQFIIPPSDAIQ